MRRQGQPDYTEALEEAMYPDYLVQLIVAERRLAMREIAQGRVLEDAVWAAGQLLGEASRFAVAASRSAVQRRYRSARIRAVEASVVSK
jgi:hypothetical protein